MGEVKVESHSMGPTFSRLTTLFFSCQWDIPFLSNDFLKNWPWKSRVKVMDEVKIQSQNVGLTSYRLTSLSFHVNRSSYSWVTFLKKLTLKIKAQCHWWGHISKSQHGSNIPSTHIPLMSICHPFPELRLFQNLTLKIKGQDHVTVQSQDVGLISYRRTSISLHVIQPSHSWDTKFPKF